MTIPSLNSSKVCLVVAHLDDEILFFNSVLACNPEIKICFLDSSDKKVTEGRRKLIKSKIFPNFKYLSIKQPNAFMKSNLSIATSTSPMLKLAYGQKNYDQTFEVLISKLKPLLKEFDVVFTHNPWGEYGHEEHILVYEAVKALKSECGYKIFVNGYISERSLKIFNQTKNDLSPASYVLPINQELASNYKNTYINYGCWTWNNDYEWPSFDVMYEVVDDEINTFDSTPFILSFLPVRFRETILKRVIKEFMIFMRSLIK